MWLSASMTKPVIPHGENLCISTFNALLFDLAAAVLKMVSSIEESSMSLPFQNSANRWTPANSGSGLFNGVQIYANGHR